MDNTIENKAKFFALYYGQNVRFWTLNGPSVLSKVGHTYMTKAILDSSTLELKQMKSLSKADYKYILENEIMNPATWEDEDVTSGKLGNLDLSDVTTVDYLRSKGYALPFMGLSVEKQVEYGWVKLKEREVSNG